MGIFEYLIKIPIGYILGWIYDFTGNYGVALILFTLAIKILLLPLGLKQQKSMTKIQKLQPQLQKLQEKYKNDQNMLSQETMKLYKEYGASPMGGCLPLLIQLPILFGLYRVIYSPLTYMLHMGTLDQIIETYTALGCDFSAVDLSNHMAQIEVAQIINNTLGETLVNFNFLGLNLAQTPSFGAVATLIIPLLAGVTTYLTSKITAWMAPKKEETEPKKPERILSPTQKTQNQGPDAQQMTKTMSLIMPIFTVWITYTLPMTLGVYWVASNVFSMIQTVVLNGYYSKKLEAEMDIIASEKAQAKAEKQKNKKRGN